MTASRMAFAGAVSLFVAGCADPVADAQKDFDFLLNHGSLAEACEAGKKWEAAAAKTRDRGKYVSASVKAFGACMDRDIFDREGYDPRHPEIQADNLELLTDLEGNAS